jgi:hypothetical protein
MTSPIAVKASGLGLVREPLFKMESVAVRLWQRRLSSSGRPGFQPPQFVNHALFHDLFAAADAKVRTAQHGAFCG